MSTGCQRRHGRTVRSVSFESLEHTRFSPDQAERYAGLAQYEVAIAVGRSTVGVRFSRASAARAFTERFADMLADRAPDTVVYAVTQAGAAYFWRSPERVRHWPEKSSDELLVFFADNFALHEHLTTSADVGVHAAVIASDSRVVALVGLSTSGKTTTAIAAVRNGFRLYSDERCIIEDGLIVPFLRAITVREGGRTLLLADPTPACPVNVRLRELPAHDGATIRPRTLCGERAGGPARPLDAVFVIEGCGAAPRVESCDIYSVLPALLGSMTSRDRGIERPARLLAALREVRVYRLRLGTPHATAQWIERTLDEAFSGAHR